MIDEIGICYPARVATDPRTQRNRATPLLPPVPLSTELGVEKMPVPMRENISYEVCDHSRVPTNHTVYDQGSDWKIAKSTSFRPRCECVAFRLMCCWDNAGIGCINYTRNAIARRNRRIGFSLVSKNRWKSWAIAQSVVVGGPIRIVQVRESNVRRGHARWMRSHHLFQYDLLR